MGNIYKILLLVICFATVTDTMAQRRNKKKKPAKEEEILQIVDVEEEIEDSEMELEIVIEDDEQDSKPQYTDQFLSKYKFAGEITNGFKWFYDKNVDSSNRKYGIVSPEGEIVLPNIFSKTYSSKMQQSLELADKEGVFDLEQRKWIVPLRYSSLKSLANDHYLVKENGLYGIVDSEGKVVLDFEWTSYQTISSLENYLIFGLGDYNSRKKGIYSLLEQKVIVPCIYDDISKLYNQNLFKVERGGLYNVIDMNNTLRFSNWFEKLRTPYRVKNRYIVMIGNRYGVIDSKENYLIPAEYIEISTEGYSDGSYMAQNKEGKFGCITLDGNVTLPFIYDELSKSRGDNVISAKGGKCGLVKVNSGTPHEISTCDYDDINRSSGVFITKKNGKFGMLDESGNLVLKHKYDELKILSNGDGNPFIDARIGKKHYLLNGEGSQVCKDVARKFDIIGAMSCRSYYSRHFSFLKVQMKNGKYKIIDKVGKSMSEPIFDDIADEYKNTFMVAENGKWGLYHLLSKKMVVASEFDLLIFDKDHFIGLKGNNAEIIKIRGTKLTRQLIVK